LVISKLSFLWHKNSRNFVIYIYINNIKILRDFSGSYVYGALYPLIKFINIVSYNQTS